MDSLWLMRKTLSQLPSRTSSLRKHCSKSKSPWRVHWQTVKRLVSSSCVLQRSVCRVEWYLWYTMKGTTSGSIRSKMVCLKRKGTSRWLNTSKPGEMLKPWQTKMVCNNDLLALIALLVQAKVTDALETKERLEISELRPWLMVSLETWPWQQGHCFCKKHLLKRAQKALAKRATIMTSHGEFVALLEQHLSEQTWQISD